MTPQPHRPRQAPARRGRVVFALAIASFAAPGLLAPGCERTPTVQAGPTHRVRAKVVSLPKEGDPSSSFTLLHEDIPEWLRPDGTKGMHAMQMPFPVAPGVSLAGLAPGDKVEATVRQYTSGPSPYEVIALRTLPKDAVLTLPE